MKIDGIFSFQMTISKNNKNEEFNHFKFALSICHAKNRRRKKRRNSQEMVHVPDREFVVGRGRGAVNR